MEAYEHPKISARAFNEIFKPSKEAHQELTDDAGENTHEDVGQQFAADWMVIIESNW